MQAGYFNLPHHSALYVSRGTGTWGPPVRFLSPPQITVFDLMPEK
jgi:predicted MPP superfamily phosphohydrolase